MDYGKLALIKTEELENKLLDNTKNTIKSYTINVKRDFSFTSSIKLARLVGKQVCMFFDVRLECSSSGNFNLGVMVNDVMLNSIELSSNGGKIQANLFCIGDTGDLFLTCDNKNVKIISVQILIFSGEIIADSSVFSLCKHNNTNYLLVDENSVLNCYCFGDNDTDLVKCNQFAYSQSAQLINFNGLCLVYLDYYDNVWLYNIQSGTTRILISDYKVDNLSALVYDGEAYLAFVSNNTLYQCKIGNVVTLPSKILDDVYAAEYVSNSCGDIVVERKGQCFLLSPLPQKQLKSTVNISMEVLL